jgi:hypothetical protein
MKLRTLFTAMLASTSVAAATTDSVRMGPQYADQVFYTLGSGEVHRSPVASWHLAFSIPGYDAAVLTNGAIGIELRHVAGSTMDDWASLDTTGMTAWPVLHNDASHWMRGAFKRIKTDDDDFDFGWGRYSMITHTVTGSTLFVLTMPDRSVKKVRIDGLADRTWQFTMANPDGSQEQSMRIDRREFAGKLFAYVDLASMAVIDREPNASWDLTFTRYTQPVPTGPATSLDYPVMGILSHPDVRTAAVVGRPASAVMAPTDTAAYSAAANAIGADWKRFDAGRWSLNDSTAWFIRARSGTIFRFVPLAFSGGSTGTTTFRVEAIPTHVDEGRPSSAIALTPSMVTAGDAPLLVTDGAHSPSIRVVDARGVTVLALPGTPGFTATPIPTHSLPAGRYTVLVTEATSFTSLPLVVVR